MKLTYLQTQVAKGALSRLSATVEVDACDLDELAKDIRQAAERGASSAQIAAALTGDAGIKVSEAQIEKILRRPDVDRDKWAAGVAEQSGDDDVDTFTANASNSAMSGLVDRAASVNQG